MFVTKVDSLFLSILVIFSLVYFIFVDTFLFASQIAQVSIIFVMMAWFIVIKNRVLDYYFIIVISFLLFFQGVYFLTVVIAYIAYVLGKRLSEKTVNNHFLFFSFIVAFLSLINFYAFTVPVYYSHYFLPVSHRLIGLDASPTMVAFSSGLAVLLLFWKNDVKKLTKFFLILFFLIVLLLTASRTALLGIVLGLIVAFFKRGIFSIYILLLVISPLVLSFIYILHHDAFIRLIIESLTSNRIINWVNIVNFFFDKQVVFWFFGIGKPPIIDDPLMLNSVSDLYVYKFVTYAESSWLKVLTYHGVFVFALTLFYVVKKSYKLDSYRSRVILAYIVFGGIFYDSVLSVQYALILILLFTTLDNGMSYKYLFLRQRI